MNLPNTMTLGNGPYDSIIEDYYHVSPDEIAEDLNLCKADFDAMHVKGNLYFSLTTVFIEFRMRLKDDAMWVIPSTFVVKIDGVEVVGKRRDSIMAAVDCTLDEVYQNLY